MHSLWLGQSKLDLLANLSWVGIFRHFLVLFRQQFLLFLFLSFLFSLLPLRA
jgi:hypothetical protein